MQDCHLQTGGPSSLSCLRASWKKAGAHFLRVLSPCLPNHEFYSSYLVQGTYPFLHEQVPGPSDQSEGSPVASSQSHSVTRLHSKAKETYCVIGWLNLKLLVGYKFLEGGVWNAGFLVLTQHLNT